MQTIDLCGMPCTALTGVVNFLLDHEQEIADIDNKDFNHLYPLWFYLFGSHPVRLEGEDAQNANP